MSRQPAELDAHPTLDNHPPAGPPSTRGSISASPDPGLVPEPRRALVRRAHRAQAQARDARRGQQLNADIGSSSDHWNDDPVPYVWTKDSR